MKIVQFISIASYLVVTSQLLFYWHILGDAQRLISLENFLEQRKIIDSRFGMRFRISYYSTLILMLILMVVLFEYPQSPVFITSLIAFVFLLADVVLAMRINMPINVAINTYDLADTTKNWEVMRTKWLDGIAYRGYFTIAGMLSLIAGLIINQK